MQLNNKRVIVTGGARGIGAAVVAAFVNEGAHVASLDLSESAPQEAIEGNGWARSHICDVSDTESVKRAFAWAAAQLGGLDVLVNAAGIAPNATADEITLDEWEKVFAVNARGTFLTNRAAYEHMHQGGGEDHQLRLGRWRGRAARQGALRSKQGRGIGMDTHCRPRVGSVRHYR